MHLKLYRLDIPFTTAFRHHSAVRTATQSVWVKVQSGECVGMGEGCPREYVTGESIASVQTFFHTYCEALCQTVGSVEALVAWAADHTAVIDANPAGWCAIELAMLEFFAKREGVTVEQLVAVVPTTGTFRYSAVVGDSKLDVFQETVARYCAMGFTDFKLKLSGDPAQDRAKVDALRDLTDVEKLRVRVDANNLWNDAESAVRHLNDLQFSFVGIEEPLSANALDGMRMVAAQTGVPIILDESLLRADQIPAFAADPDYWIVNIRVSKMGGLLRSLAVLRAAHAAGISIIVGAQVGETSVLTRAGLVVARAAAGGLFAQEGAFGTHLLQTDVAHPPLMFGPAGVLNADAYGLSERVGWGLTLRLGQEFTTSLSRE
ncbi:MAG: enolase C-terminal domain-like protein [Vicinamibacterales bacterium]|jgi:L-alanine-DL-glutamate epimerase-like enolase superfamily enzyme|nr:enolase C-terminal domain-like protein [Vicinamibacterales bacterium]|tara:strand:+ start:2810 stop:3937 length:1128 start_codon:yes stop_codon:yes gene_type:complete